MNSKIEGAKMIRTLLGSSIDEIDTQIWLAERLSRVDVNKLTGCFFCSTSASLDNPKPGKTKLAIHIREYSGIHWCNNRHMRIKTSNISDHVKDIPDDNKCNIRQW